MKIKNLALVFLITSLFGCNTGNIKSNTSGIGSVGVTPEEELHVLVSIQNGEIISVSEVSDGGNVTFSLSKMSSGMMLSASNTLDHIIKYDVYMIDSNGKKHYTSSCPMMAGAGVFESWSHNIPKLSIENFRVLPDDGQLACQ